MNEGSWPSSWRMACRGGFGDTFCDGPGMTTCDAFCTSLEGGGILDSSYTAPPPVAYYAKCYNESGSVPPNGVRFQYLSQLGTASLDPAMPTMNEVNRSSCRRMLHSFNYMEEWYFNSIFVM